MKKFLRVLVLLIVIFPIFIINVYAEKISTTVVGVEKLKPGETVSYTVIVDMPLTEYKAEIEYDRDVLNLVEIEEINIDSFTKDFSYEKNDPIVVGAKSKEKANVIYSLVFTVKNYYESPTSEIKIKTTLAKDGSTTYDSSEVYNKINIVKEDELFIDEDKDQNKELTKTLNSVSKFLKENNNIVLVSSISLNVILLILLIISLKRKKVDYDF